MMLEGERVIIFPPSLDHAPLIYDAVIESKLELAEFLPWVEYVQSVEDSIISCKASIENYKTFNDELRFSIFCTKTNNFLGIISLKIINKSIGFFEIGYWLRTSSTGNGYMIEAINLLEQHAFSKLEAKRLEIRVADNNIKSINTIKQSSYNYEGKLMNAIQLPNDALGNALVFGKISI